MVRKMITVPMTGAYRYFSRAGWGGFVLSLGRLLREAFGVGRW